MTSPQHSLWRSLNVGDPNLVDVVAASAAVAKVSGRCRSLIKDGVTRVFEDKLEPYAYQPLDDVATVADKVRALLKR